MKQRLCTTILLAFSIAENVVPSVRAQQTSPCDSEMISFCEEESNRYCFLDSESKPVCGNCLDGFIEWRARCLQDEAVDLELFLSEYEPNYLNTLSTESRTELLTAAIQFIAAYQNQNPPLPFELGLNTFSADSPEEALALRGFNATASSSKEPVPLSKLSLMDSTQNLSSTVDWVEQGAVTAVKDQVSLSSHKSANVVVVTILDASHDSNPACLHVHEMDVARSFTFSGSVWMLFCKFHSGCD